MHRIIKFLLLFSFGNEILTDICASIYPRPADFRLTNFTKSPYYLIQSDNFYKDDQAILVEIGGSSFRGFLLAAVDPLTGRRIGSFVETQGIFTLPCSTAIHSDYHLKKHALLMWRPPRHSKGFVAFEITIMDESGRFLVGQISILPHQLFTHLQMIPVYTRAPPPQISPSYPTTSVSINNFPESSSSTSSTSSSSSSSSHPSSIFPEKESRYNMEDFYRFVPMLVPTLSRPPLSHTGNEETDPGQGFYLSAESSNHPQTIIGSKSQLPCAEKNSHLMTASSSPEVSSISAQQHHLSSSTYASSFPAQTLSSSNISGNENATSFQLISGPGIQLNGPASLSNGNHHNNQPLNQLLGKLLHSITANGQK